MLVKYKGLLADFSQAHVFVILHLTIYNYHRRIFPWWFFTLWHKSNVHWYCREISFVLLLLHLVWSSVLVLHHCDLDSSSLGIRKYIIYTSFDRSGRKILMRKKSFFLTLTCNRRHVRMNIVGVINTVCVQMSRSMNNLRKYESTLNFMSEGAPYHLISDIFVSL